MSSVNELEVSNIVSGEDAEFVKSLPVYEIARNYLFKRNLTPEKVKIAYRKFRPSLDEKAFRLECKKLNLENFVVSKPGKGPKKSLSGLDAIFRVENEEFQVTALSEYGSMLLITFTIKRITHLLNGEGDQLKAALKAAKDEGSPTVNIGFLPGFSFTGLGVALPISCVEEVCQNDDIKSYLGWPYHVTRMNHKETELLRSLPKMSRDSRMDLLIASEFFLGPEAVWVNKPN